MSFLRMNSKDKAVGHLNKIENLQNIKIKTLTNNRNLARYKTQDREELHKVIRVVSVNRMKKDRRWMSS